jgi:hypothetical protein
MVDHRARPWLVPGVSLLAAGILISCGDGKPLVAPELPPATASIEEGDSTSALLKGMGINAFQRLSAPACPNKTTATPPSTPYGDCAEVWGNSGGLTIQMDLPAVNPTQHTDYECKGWGPEALTGTGPKYPIPFAGHIFDPVALSSSLFGTVNRHPSDGTFDVAPKHPTQPGSPFTVRCFVDGGYDDIDITIVPKSVPLQVASMTMTGQAWVVGVGTVQQIAHHIDNYDGLDLLVPIPTTTWSTSDATIATVTSPAAGVGSVKGKKRGVAVITATSGSVSVPKSISVESCISMALSQSGTVIVPQGTFINVVGTATCDTHVNATNEPFSWTSSNPSAVTVLATGGAPGHTGKITSVAPGSSTVTACAGPVAPYACAALVVTTGIFTTQITSSRDGSFNSELPSQSGLTMPFVVKNTGNMTGTVTLTCSATGSANCVNVNPSSVQLTAGQSQPVNVTYGTSSTTGGASIRLVSNGGGNDQINFVVEGGPLTVLINYGPSSVRPNVNCEWMAWSNGGYGPYTWAWTVNGSPVTGVDNDLYYVNSGSSFLLGVQVTDSHGTIATHAKNITVTPAAPYCNL